MSQKIKILNKNTSDKIAAGEVVDRPVSIVKELVENSIDANSNYITIEIKDGGKSYIRISDNGIGIDPLDVDIAFLRHSTSKIYSDEDLNHINTLGFRGEALSSIASVSKVEMITKTSENDTGTQIKIYGGEIVEKKIIGCPNGTTIIISDLFYNTPARLKFLKKNNIESSLIIDLISKIALAYDDIKIRLINNGSILFSTDGRGNKYKNILTIYNKEISDGLIEIREENEYIKIEGYISKPDFTRTNRKHQIFFVNGRNIKDKILEKAIEVGYKERIFEGRYPVVYLFIDIKPEIIDVNIHPNKKEIRFHEEGEVLDFVSNCIKKNITKEKSIPDIEIKTNKNIPNLLTYEHDTAKNSINEYEKVYEKNLNNEYFEYNNNEDENETQIDIKNIMTTMIENNTFNQDENFSKINNEKYNLIKNIDEENLFSDMIIKGSLFNTYIIGQCEDIFYLIDQHAAHERIFYEKLLNEFNIDEKETQSIITPIVVNASYDIKEEENNWIELIRRMGFCIEIFGNKSYIVKGIPVFMNISEAEDMLNYLISNANENIDFNNNIKIEKLITRACKSSVKANDKLKNEEMIFLIKELSKCQNPYSCPHGRPTFIKMTKYQIEKMFKRL